LILILLGRNRMGLLCGTLTPGLPGYNGIQQISTNGLLMYWVP
jgi:hypothetical protein